MKITELKVGQRVRDGIRRKYWPFHLGVVTKVLKTRVHVMWDNAELSVYDVPHLQFLSLEKQR